MGAGFMTGLFRWRAAGMAALLAAAVVPVLPSCSPECGIAPGGDAPVLGHEVVRVFPHDPEAFTQGILWHDGRFYESTGLKGRSSLREVDPESGRVLRMKMLEPHHFAEGLALSDGQLIQLTWQSNTAFAHDPATFEVKKTFSYLGEGWGLTRNGGHLIMSDGTSKLRILDPATFNVEKLVEVRDGGRPVSRLNELEMVEGRLYANIWQKDRVAVIEPESGRVEAWIDLSGLQDREDMKDGDPDVLNGIAYDADAKRLFVTGKLWPKLFEIRVLEPASPATTTPAG